MHKDTIRPRPHSCAWGQEAVRRVEGNWTDSKAIHNIDEAEAH
jgi:hypothetical protein